MIKSKLCATIKKESRQEEYLTLLKHQADKNKLQKAKENCAVIPQFKINCYSEPYIYFCPFSSTDRF